MTIARRNVNGLRFDGLPVARLDNGQTAFARQALCQRPGKSSRHMLDDQDWSSHGLGELGKQLGECRRAACGNTYDHGTNVLECGSRGCGKLPWRTLLLIVGSLPAGAKDLNLRSQ